MTNIAPISAIVVAGGQSRRLGVDKRRLRLWGDDGPTLLEHVVGVLARLSDDVIVALNDPDGWHNLPARLVRDEVRDAGALGGIAAGLAAAQHDYALVVAGDMPLLNVELLRAFAAHPRDYDVLVAPVADSGSARNPLAVESLHAIYARACLAPIRAALERSQRQITSFFGDVRVAYVEPDVVRRYDPNGTAFLNVNTPEQLAEVQRLLNSS